MQNRRIPLIVGGVVALVALSGGLWWYLDAQRYEKTDNAYVQADTVTISPQITGYVADVPVSDNQTVSPGQVLVRLDPSEAQAALAQAEANVAAASAAVRNVEDRMRLAQSQIAQSAAGVVSAQAQADLAQTELRRYGVLADKGWVAAQRLQTATATAQEARAGVAQAQAALEAQRRQAATLGSTRSQGEAGVAQARAALEAARINLDRTVIRAPVAGVVGARTARPGLYVRPGSALMAVVPLGRTYVIANFKETQVARMRIGQTVSLKADAFPGKAIRGRVASFAPATGSEFALIPVENDTGNFTKIVQRVPVRIEVAPDDPLAAALRPGLSVVVKVDLKSAGGMTFAQAAQALAAGALARNDAVAPRAGR